MSRFRCYSFKDAREQAKRMIDKGYGTVKIYSMEEPIDIWKVYVEYGDYLEDEEGLLL